MAGESIAPVNIGGPPFAELHGALAAVGLGSSYAAAADDVALDGPIRQFMAEAFAGTGG
jgi:hypothetical protein